MRNPRTNTLSTSAIVRVLIAVAIAFAFAARTVAQTPGGTTISNQASATYSDGTNSYSTVSNTVTVTVSNVSGLAITPDAGSNPTVVAGQTGVLYNFTVTNTVTLQNGIFATASGNTVNANKVLLGTGTTLRIAGSTGNSMLNVGPGGIVATGGTIEVKFTGAPAVAADSLAMTTARLFIAN